MYVGDLIVSFFYLQTNIDCLYLIFKKLILGSLNYLNYLKENQRSSPTMFKFNNIIFLKTTNNKFDLSKDFLFYLKIRIKNIHFMCFIMNYSLSNLSNH